MSKSIFGSNKVPLPTPPLRPGSRGPGANSNSNNPCQASGYNQQQHLNVAATVEALVSRLQESLTTTLSTTTIAKSSTNEAGGARWKAQLQEWSRGAQTEISKLMTGGNNSSTKATPANSGIINNNGSIVHAPGDAYSVKHTALPSGDLLCFEDIPEDNSEELEGEDRALQASGHKTSSSDSKTTASNAPVFRMVESGSNTLPWPRVGDWEGERLVKTLTASRAQAVNERQNAILRNHRLLSELNETRRELAKCKDSVERLEYEHQEYLKKARRNQSPARKTTTTPQKINSDDDDDGDELGSDDQVGAFRGTSGLPVMILLGSGGYTDSQEDEEDCNGGNTTNPQQQQQQQQQQKEKKSKIPIKLMVEASTQAEQLLIVDDLGGGGTTNSLQDTAASSSPSAAAQALQFEVDAQKVVLTSLENEVHRLRKDRDAHHTKQQTDFDNLVKELEETRESLEETNSVWDDKMKELNRLRTLMRFSQLKEDSDKLPMLHKRVDELETSVRRYQMASQRFEKDQSEYRRLRLLDAHCRAIADRGGSMEEVPPHLLLMKGSGSGKEEKVTMVGAGGVQRAQSTSQGTAAEPIAAASHDGSSSSASSTLVGPPLKNAAEGLRADKELPCLSETGVKSSPSSSVKQPNKKQDEDVSFSTIAQRMQQYMKKKKEEGPVSTTGHQERQQPSSHSRPQSSSSSTAKRQRPGTAGSLRTASSSSVGGGSGGQYSLSKISTKYTTTNPSSGSGSGGGGGGSLNGGSSVAGPLLRPNSARALRSGSGSSTTDTTTEGKPSSSSSKGDGGGTVGARGYSFIGGRLVPFYKKTK